MLKNNVRWFNVYFNPFAWEKFKPRTREGSRLHHKGGGGVGGEERAKMLDTGKKTEAGSPNLSPCLATSDCILNVAKTH